MCSPISSARLLPTSADAKSSAAPEVPVSTSRVVGSVTLPSPAAGGDRFFLGAVVLPSHGQRAAADEQPRQRDTALERSAGRAADVDDQLRRAALHEIRDPRLCLLGGARADGGDAQIADARRGDLAGDVAAGDRLARQFDDVRIGGAAADDRELDLGAGRAAQPRACLRTPTSRASACRR